MQRFPTFAVFASCLILFLDACGGERNAGADTSGARVEDAAHLPSAARASASDTSIALSGHAVVADGAVVYQRCAACHQANGAGVAGTYPPLAGSEIAMGAPGRMIDIVLHGLTGPIVVHGASYNGTMPPFGTGAPLSDAEVAAVVTYVRHAWGNTAGPVNASDVARERGRG
jgi:mono/diheme cytochrome c family protein